MPSGSWYQPSGGSSGIAPGAQTPLTDITTRLPLFAGNRPEPPRRARADLEPVEARRHRLPERLRLRALGPLHQEVVELERVAGEVVQLPDAGARTVSPGGRSVLHVDRGCGANALVRAIRVQLDQQPTVGGPSAGPAFQQRPQRAPVQSPAPRCATGRCARVVQDRGCEIDHSDRRGGRVGWSRGRSRRTDRKRHPR